MRVKPQQTPLIVSCGIFRREIEYLIEKNKWPIGTRFLDSSLHIDFNRLQSALTGTLKRIGNRPALVVYGACHPCMDELLAISDTTRTPGQNCVEILLGHDHFTRELAAGAFFLIEDWARRWNMVITRSFGNRPELIREVFQDAHTHLLGLRTKCSGDFRKEAENAANEIGLSLKWFDVDLKHLEKTLKLSIEELTNEGNP